MSAILRLEDGRALHRSNMGYCGMLELIADAVSTDYLEFRSWLKDMAGRTSPFCEFDLRGLNERCRGEFWCAAERAWGLILNQFGSPENWPQHMYAGESLGHLLRLHRSIEAGEPPTALNDLDYASEYSGTPIDTSDLWGTDV